MKKWILRLLYTALVLLPVGAIADYTATTGTGATVFAFVCSVSKICPATVLIDSSNVEKATAGNPLRTDPTGTTTQPISAASLPTHGVTVASGGVASGAMVDLGAQADAAAAADNSTASLIALLKRTNQNLTTLNTTAGSPQPAGTNRVGYTTDDPCNSAATKVYTPVNVVTATNVVIAGVSAKKKYLCGIFLYPGGTDNIAVYQATTGTSCATAPADIFGGHTTATGFIATAQAGFVVGTGSAAFAATNTVNTDICITTSAAVQLSGAVVTVDQ